MKFPLAMLRDFVATSLTAVEVGDLLTMAGFELEGIEEVDGDAVLDVKVMSNRGDGLSVFGLAREVLAKDLEAKPTDLYLRACQRFPVDDDGDEGEAGCLTQITIQTEDCGRYACRLFRNAPNASSPEWVQKRLSLAGMRPISVLVDLTNYVMLELGQPLHAFDMDRLSGPEIVVRQAREGETLTTLDGASHELRPNQMMICDRDKPVAAAGIMGGLDTEVVPETQTMLLESAHFRNASIRKTRKQLGLSTEASYRFERSVDPNGVVAALNRFKELLAGIDGGASAVAGVIDVYPGRTDLPPIRLRIDRTVRLLGMDVTRTECQNYLERLGMSVTVDGEGLKVAPPSWRPDIVREDDLIEEIGRVHGYDRIPEILPQGSTPQGGVLGVFRRVDTVREALLRLGFQEVVTHSLVGESPLDSPNAQKVAPKNPVSPEAGYLRSSLLPCLADVARRNGAKDLWLAEIGGVFRVSAQGFVESRSMGLYAQGSLWPTDWLAGHSGSADFFALKGVVDEVLSSILLRAEWAAGKDSRLHPTRQASVLVGGQVVGVVGQVHPDVAVAEGLPNDAVLAELDLDAVLNCQPAPIKAKPISRNPSVRRDIAILVDRSVPFAKVRSAIEESAGTVLEKLWLFDEFSGKGIPEGKHSLGIALQLRKPGANFTDEEANRVRDSVVAALGSLGATVR